MEEKKSGRFRKKKTSFAQVSNTALRDETLSLKAKGLLALIESYLSLDGFTLYKDFLMSKSKDGETAFRGAWKELKDHGYLIQYKIKQPKTQYFKYEYEICDNPHVGNQPTDNCDISHDSFPHVENPHVANLTDDNPTCVEQSQINNNTLLNNILKNNTLIINNIQTNIDYDPVFVNSSDKDLVDNIVDIMADVLTSNSPTFKINGNDVKSDYVKKMFLKINMNHINYTLRAISEYIQSIKNPRNFIISVLYNSVLTLDTYYTNLINT